MAKERLPDPCIPDFGAKGLFGAFYSPSHLGTRTASGRPLLNEEFCRRWSKPLSKNHETPKQPLARSPSHLVDRFSGTYHLVGGQTIGRTELTIPVNQSANFVLVVFVLFSGGSVLCLLLGLGCLVSSLHRAVDPTRQHTHDQPRTD